MDNAYGIKGDDWIQKGDKTLKGILSYILGSTFGNIFGSKGERAEKALECYKSAAT